MTEQHDCLEYLDYHEAYWTEAHGEPCSSEWYRCSKCGAEYTEAELDAMLAEDEPADPLLIAQVIGPENIYSRMRAAAVEMAIIDERRIAEGNPRIGRAEELALLRWNEESLMAAEVGR